MKEFVFILESIRYDLFQQANVPNMKSVGDVECAKSHGHWTLPAILSIFSGYLPESKHTGKIWEPSWVLFGFDNLKTLFLNSNAWVNNRQPRRYDEIFFEDPTPQYLPLPDEFEKAAANQSEYDRIVIFIQETHGPYTQASFKEDLIERIRQYNHENVLDPELPPFCMEAQTETLEWVDKEFGNFLDALEGTPRIIITSDHGELFGENNKIGHDPSYPFDIKLIEVPLLVTYDPRSPLPKGGR